jgi:cytochrome P450
MVPADRPTFLVLTYDLVREVLTNTTVWSSERDGPEAVVMGPRAMSGSDDPYHKRLRDLVLPTFRRSTMERWRSDCIEPVLTALIDRLHGKHSVELISDLTFPFPFLVTASVIGFTVDLHIEAHDLLRKAWATASDVEMGRDAGQRLRDLMDVVLRHWEDTPGNNLITDLLNAEIDGQRLEREEILTLMRLLLTASSETTNRNASLLLHALLSHPDQLELLRDDLSLLPRAIDEQLRWEPGGPLLPRVARCDVDLAGVTIPAGSFVIACVTMANRDPARWDNPDRFDITRDPQLHFAFGGGPHMCPGQHLAKEVIRAEVEALLRTFPNIRFDPERPRPFVAGAMFRTPRTLPVVLD